MNGEDACHSKCDEVMLNYEFDFIDPVATPRSIALCCRMTKLNLINGMEKA